MENINTIKTNVKNWSKKFISKDFEFRPEQFEVICNIIYEKLNNIYNHHIIQAPTGSGKSLINIISAGVLWLYYNRKSYILCSDLYLYKQYIDFIQKYNLEDFKYLKGQTGNYICKKNLSDMKNAPCRITNCSYLDIGHVYYSKNDNEIDKLLNPKSYKLAKVFPCIRNCKYYGERFDAIDAPITIMTYDLFYFQMNICDNKFDSHGYPIFGQFLYRHYIFCDECHNIPSLLQNRSKPVIKYEDFQKMIHIYNFYKVLKNNKTNNLINKLNDINIKENFFDYWSKMNNNKLTSYDNTILLLNYTKKLVNYVYIVANRIQGILGTKILNGYTLTQKEKEIYSHISWIQNYHCFLSDFCSAIELSGYHYTYKQIQKNTITFGCVKEDGIIFQFLLKYGLSGSTLCSATIGNKDSFIENCGYKHFENNENEKYDELLHYVNRNNKIAYDNFKFNKLKSKVNFININSYFDFSTSPIIIDLNDKMTYKTKTMSIIPIANKINNILNKHQNENGLIQTGSYENAQNLLKYISKDQKSRLLVYKNSKEKETYINKINKNTNYIIVGPSLNEGIDLPGNLCSFICIIKVPYLSLADKYVSSKMKIFKKWYNDTTMNNIIQGIGRGNRFKNDSCTIYILDGCFKRLFSYTKKYWPNYITNRFIYTNIDNYVNSKNKKLKSA